MRRYLLAITISIFFSFSLKAQAEVSFDSLRNYYNAKLAAFRQAGIEEELDPEAVLARLNNAIASSEDLSQELLFDILNFTSRAQAKRDLDPILEIYNHAILASESLSVKTAFLQYKLGDYYKLKNQSIAALEHFLKSSLILEQVNDVKGLAFVYSEISIINFDGLNNQIADNYASDAVACLKKAGLQNREDSVFLSRLYNLLGVCNRRLRNYEKAIEMIDHSILFSQDLGDSLFVSIEKGNKAAIYYEKGDFGKAIPFLKEDFKVSSQNHVYNSAFNAGVILCDIYLKQEQYEKADSLYSILVDMKQKYDFRISDNSMLPFLKLKADYWESKGDEAKSKDIMDNYRIVDLRMDSVRRASDFDRLQEKYLMEKEITKLELLQKTNQLQSTHLKLRTTILIIIAFALIVVLWYVYVLRHKNRKIDKLNELLEMKVSERTNRLMEINKELDNYLYRASHDIRRPIRTLLGLNNVVKFTEDPAELKGLFEKVYDTAMNMDEMLFKLQMAYELNNSHQIETVEVYDLIDHSINGMTRLIELKNANVIVRKNINATSLQANNALIKIAIDNIIENALIYHNEEHPQIEITTDEGRYYFYIHIQDNGYGIAEDYHGKIFESYFKISNKTQGSGLGLFLAHKAISFLAGDIVLDSVINEGTKFTIKVPINPK